MEPNRIRRGARAVVDDDAPRGAFTGAFRAWGEVAVAGMARKIGGTKA